MHHIRSVALPEESLIVRLYPSPGLADAYAISLPPDAPLDIETLARLLLEKPPYWFRGMLACRDAMVKPFGIQTSVQLRKKLMASGMAHIDFFPLLSVEGNELIIGENDSHLDFRASVLVRNRQADDKREVVMTTVVHCHNLTGRLYIRFIAPFHRRVVCSMLSRAADKNWR